MSTNKKLGLGFAAVAALAGTASAQPDSTTVSDTSEDSGDSGIIGPERFSIGAFAGAQYLSSDIGVGSMTDPTLRPRSAPLMGARFSAIALSGLGQDERGYLDLGFEGEVGMAASYTGHEGTRNGPYFSPLISYRANILLRLTMGRVRPHFALGGGAVTFASTSPTLNTQTVGTVFWGVGATFAVNEDWMLRFDLRQDMLPRVDSGLASSFEATFGLAVPLGREHREHVVAAPPPPPPPVVKKEPPPPPPVTTESTVTVKTAPGPTAPMPMGSIPDPTLDTDKDGIPDVHDKCPLDAETVNGFADKDGCPDTIPQAITVAGPSLKFAPARAKLDAADETTLKAVIDVMVANPELKLDVVGHPDAKGKKGEELAQRRAESVRWFLIEHGVAEVSRVTSKVGEVAAKGGAIIDLEVVAPPAAK